MNRPLTKKLNAYQDEIFPPEDLSHKYKVKRIIGKGQYGYVAKAVRKQTKEHVAIKKLINVFQNQFQTKRILRQIVLLKNCKHPNIVSLIQVMLPKHQTLENFNTIYIVTQYCDADLRKAFKTEELFLQVNDVKYILYQIACGIKYLHSASIIHRDLTPSNILINNQGMRIKICDLGLARIVEKKQVQNIAENSSDQQNLQQEIKIMTLEQKNVMKNQFMNVYELIETESLPSTPNTQTKINSPNFQDSENFVMKRRNSNQIIKPKQQNQQDLTQSGDLDQLRGSQKTQHQKQTTINKKRGLKRMGSIRVGQNNGNKLSPTTSEKQKKSTKDQNSQKKQEKKASLTNPLAKLTLKVTTRWYRAPQVILLQKGYHKPIDVWSFGCLFGQLLKMIKSVCYNSLQRFPLFPGKHCYPVSPATLQNINRQHSQKEQNAMSYKNDQLFMILSTIGKPSQQEMQFLTDDGAKNYIRKMDDFKRKQFKKFFPTVPSQAIDILQKTLLFNPNSRYTIDDIINHPFFDNIKNKQMEIQATPIIMQFEQQQNLTLEMLKTYLSNEIKSFY